MIQRLLHLSTLLSIGVLLCAFSSCARADYVSGGLDGNEEQQDKSPYAKAGFFVKEADGRLWVFKEGSDALMQFKTHGEPAKFNTAIGVGPGGMTIRSDSRETIIAYLAAKDGFFTTVHDGRLWVLEKDSEALAQFQDVGEPAKNVTLVGKGPMGISIRSDDNHTIIKWKASKTGFFTTVHDNRLWVLEKGSEALAQFQDVGEPAKNVTLVGKGPLGISLRSDDMETVLKWSAQVDGFNTYIRDGRIWVFKPGSEHEMEFKKVGEPAKSVTKVGAGPMRCTVRAAEADVMHRYLRSL